MHNVWVQKQRHLRNPRSNCLVYIHMWVLLLKGKHRAWFKLSLYLEHEIYERKIRDAIMCSSLIFIFSSIMKQIILKHEHTILCSMYVRIAVHEQCYWVWLWKNERRKNSFAHIKFMMMSRLRLFLGDPTEKIDAETSVNDLTEYYEIGWWKNRFSNDDSFGMCTKQRVDPWEHCDQKSWIWSCWKNRRLLYAWVP